ncbi:hypothetical protein T02_16339 [Trichinella nativa]|uniref:Uncharacterized protein n=1 Tax=Trichinella nativa TaxID=6335 RepID=A0A0V1KPX3_9BILA|nr:hypothetical protein T02_16339 [Trichinella nativa]
MCVKLSQVVSTTATANLREAVLTTFVYNNIARNQKNVSPIFKNVNPHFHEKTEKKSETTIKKKYNQKRNKSANIIKSQLGKEIIVVAARTGAAMQLITDRSICDTQHLECGVHRQVSLESTEDEYTDYKEGKYEKESRRQREFSTH